MSKKPSTPDTYDHLQPRNRLPVESPILPKKPSTPDTYDHLQPHNRLPVQATPPQSQTKPLYTEVNKAGPAVDRHRKMGLLRDDLFHTLAMMSQIQTADPKLKERIFLDIGRARVLIKAYTEEGNTAALSKMTVDLQGHLHNLRLVAAQTPIAPSVQDLPPKPKKSLLSSYNQLGVVHKTDKENPYSQPKKKNDLENMKKQKGDKNARSTKHLRK